MYTIYLLMINLYLLILIIKFTYNKIYRAVILNDNILLFIYIYLLIIWKIIG